VRLRGLTERIPTRVELRVFLGYCAAAAIYIAIGVAVTDFLYSFWVGVAYVLVVTWAVPAALRRRS
jgi:hypothetical protein